MISLQALLILLGVFALAQAYPAIVFGSDLNRADLFISQEQLIERLMNKNQMISVYNIQTSYEESDSFVRQLKLQTQKLRLLQNLMENSLVTPYIDYNAQSFVQEAQAQAQREGNEAQVSSTTANFLNLDVIEKDLIQLNKQRELKDKIIVILFSKINPNIKILQEINTDDQIVASQISSGTQETTTAGTTTVADAITENKVKNMTSSMIAGYLIFFAGLFTIWTGVSCMMDIKAPERFIKTNFQFGKEN